MSRKASTRVAQAEEDTCVFFLSRHCLLLDTKYVLCFEPFLEELQPSSYLLTPNAAALLLQNLNLSLSLEDPCLFCCIMHQIENFACQGKQRSIKDLNMGLSVAKDKQENERANSKYCFFVTDLMGFQ